jgi:hypothetical protein
MLGFRFMSDEIFTTSEQPSPKKSVQVDKPTTVLDQLKDILAKKVERDPVYIEVPERPGVTIQVSPNITQHQLRSWRKNAGEDTKNGMDATKFACAVIGHTCTGIFVNGEQVVNEDDIGLTFASEAILGMTNTTRPIPDCVRAFFGIDPHVESAALAVLEAAGYSDTVEAVDPTKDS